MIWISLVFGPAFRQYPYYYYYYDCWCEKQTRTCWWCVEH